MEKLKAFIKKYYEGLAYLFFGGLATLLNLVLFAVFQAVLGTGFATGIGNVLDNIICILFAYWTNRPFVFRSKNSGQAALAEFMRGLGFVPLIATTALATGVYAVAGFTFVYAVGYLSPNPMVAAVLGAVVISAEVLLLRSIGKWLGRYPSVRNASDNIRNAMNMLMEVALLVGSIFAAIKMAGYTGFSIAVAIYFLNESLGRPVQKMAAPVVAVMITGILLNVLYWLGLFVPA